MLLVYISSLLPVLIRHRQVVSVAEYGHRHQVGSRTQKTGYNYWWLFKFCTELKNSFNFDFMYHPDFFLKYSFRKIGKHYVLISMLLNTLIYGNR